VEDMIQKAREGGRQVNALMPGCNSHRVVMRIHSRVKTTMHMSQRR